MDSACGRRWAIWWFLAWLLFYLATASGRISHGDDETRFQMTQNLFERQTLSIGHRVVGMPAMPAPGLLPQQGYAFETTFATVSPKDGRVYSRYGPGQSLLTLPLYLLGRAAASGPWAGGQAHLTRLAVALWNPLVGAACVLTLVGFLVRLGFRRGTAFLASGAYGLASMAWPHAKEFFSEPTVALCLLLGVWQVHEWRGSRRLNHLWLAGATSALGILFRPTTAFLHVPWLTAYLLWPGEGATWRPRQILRALAVWGLPIAIGASLVAAYNTYCWGSPLASGYPDAEWNVPFLLGMWGQLFSPGKSVFLYTPWLVAAFVGWALEWKRSKALAVLVTALWVAYLAFHASYQYWTGGWNWGPRLLLPVLPLAAVGLASLWESRQVRGARILVVVLFLAGFLIQLPAVLVSHSRYLVLLSERVGEGFYVRSLYEPALSPVVNQWPMVREVWDLWRDAEARTQARMLVADHTRRMQTQARDLEAAGAEALWLSEFFRLNAFDFWWLHLGLLGAPLGVTWGIPALLLGGSLATFWKCWQSFRSVENLSSGQDHDLASHIT
ncbi:MAG: ArnT family glycosyltransferase [Anaerolineae bacterium]